MITAKREQERDLEVAVHSIQVTEPLCLRVDKLEKISRVITGGWGI